MVVLTHRKCMGNKLSYTIPMKNVNVAESRQQLMFIEEIISKIFFFVLRGWKHLNTARNIFKVFHVSL